MDAALGTTVAALEAMSLIDFLIIYFAAGSPFAVYKLLNTSARKFPAAAEALAAWLFWPIVGTTTLFDARSREIVEDGKRNKSGRTTDSALWNKVRDIHRDHGPLLTSADRDVIDRYVGLALAIADTGPAHKIPEIFRVIGREDGPAGAACLMRRNLARLRSHHKDAREQFLALAGSSDRPALSIGLASIAELVGDGDAADRIANRLREDVTKMTAENIWVPEQEYLKM